MKNFPLAFLLLLAVPAIAQTSSGYLDQSGSWKWEHDTGTPGSSTGQLISVSPVRRWMVRQRSFSSPILSTVANAFIRCSAMTRLLPAPSTTPMFIS